jgi:hypothetical protein
MKPTYKIPADYEYVCDGIRRALRDYQETIVEHKIYFCVVCTDCSNVPVLHLLTRSSGGNLK